MDELWPHRADAQRPIRNLVARLWTEIGLAHYLQKPVRDHPQLPDHHERTSGLTAALDAWNRALEAAPEKPDCLFYRGLAQTEANPARPALAEASMSRLLSLVADRALQADVTAALGDAYFGAGQMHEARRCYEQSRRLFELPKDINFRARKGLSGM
jgi:tetratricopeptide (TPR) repeat protein